MESPNIFDIFEKYSDKYNEKYSEHEHDTEKHKQHKQHKQYKQYKQYTQYSHSQKVDTIINTNINTDAKIDNILKQIDYSDKESLQDMLNETIKLLQNQEIENDKLTIRCREFLKVIEQKHNHIKQLEEKNNILEVENNTLEEKNNTLEEKNNTLEEKNNTLEEKNNILKKKIREFDQLFKKNFFAQYI